MKYLGLLVVFFGAVVTKLSIADEPFGIQVIDDVTGRGVPLVELTTTNGISCFTDSAGCAAFQEPGLMDREVFFHVRSDGYEFPADGFGIRGQKLATTPGATATLKIHRINLAERLYRITGQGIYRDSVLLGRPVPIRHPVVNAGVLGSDSVLCVPFQRKLHWFWGDTTLAGYPLGLFHSPGATSPLPGPGVLSPGEGVDLQYFCDQDGQAVNTAEIHGSGPTWLSGLTVLRDDEGHERLFAGYAKIHPPLDVYERGIVEFNPSTSRFEHRVTFPATATLFPSGPSIEVEENGERFLYFARPFPDVRVRANVAEFLDPASYETFSCLAREATDFSHPEAVVRDRNRKPVFSWKNGVPPRDWQQERKWLESSQLDETDLPFRLKDGATGKRINAHSGSISWNQFRKRYVMIALEVMGTSLLGEVWYAESGTLSGPWSRATKIVTHEKYSFYNPIQHPEFSEQDGRFIYFEGTFTQAFSNAPLRIPRYDYNQIMYRLDLATMQLEE